MADADGSGTRVGWPRVGGLRAFGLGAPGEMRNRLTALALVGAKTATAGLWRFDYEASGEVLDRVGERQVLLDSQDRPAATVEITRVETHRFADVPWEFAEAEGEGFRDIDDWRERHRAFYAQHGLAVDDGDVVVCIWMRVADETPPPKGDVERCDRSSPAR